MTKNRFELQQSNLGQAASLIESAHREVSMASAELAVSSEWLENYKYTDTKEVAMNRVAEVLASMEIARRCVKGATLLMERHKMILDRAINDHKLEQMRVSGAVEALDSAVRMIR